MNNTIIIPAIDLIAGNIVRLYQGDYNKKQIYDTYTPIEILNKYVEQGATQLHLVDLDGAKSYEHKQTNIIKNILQKVPANIQVGGGIRNTNDVEILLKYGVNRVIIGSKAIKDKLLVKSWFKEFGPEKIVLALDVKIENNKKYIAINGWQEQSKLLLEDIVNEYLDVGLKHVLCTDISKDGTLKGSNISLYQNLVSSFPSIYWQSSGGIGSLQDVVDVKKTKVSSIIIGKALLDNKFTLEEAKTC